ncbi:MAG TPA: hypothetical protein VF181_01025 [Balneolaceae bacterium]
MVISIQKLKTLFEAQRVKAKPTKEEIEFVNKRSQIEEELPDFLSIELFLNYYDLFTRFGLEDIMLTRTENDIFYLATYEPHKFINSDFYRRFKDKRVVQKHFDISRVNSRGNIN